MAFVDSFLDWMNDTLIVQKTTRNSFGERVVASTVTYNNCRVRYVDRIVRNAMGEEKRITHIVYMPGNPTITLDDYFLFPDGGRREIVQIKREADTDGTIDHLEIAL